MPLRIVILDGATLNPGDLDWGEFHRLGAVVVHDRSTPEQVVKRSAGAQAAITNKTRLVAEALARLPDLRYIGITATGTNVVDLAAAKAHGIVITNVPGYGSDSVAQHTIALLLELACHVGTHDAAVHAGRWSNGPEWMFTVAPITELAGKILGIVGLGAIGRRVAQIGHALGMSIVAADPRRTDPAAAPGVPVRWLSLDDVFAQADVLSLHCPLTEDTRGLVNAARLARMKPTAFLLNAARGPLVDEAALAATLRSGGIAGAGLDVLCEEPPRADNPLLTAPNCIITPHCAWASIEARRRLLHQAAENLRLFLAGTPINIVDP